jgi:lipooligosaccharide transport system ATP-binding protein
MNTQAGLPAVRAESLTKQYNGLVAVNKIDFEIKPGECFGLLGPNGAGKTSTVKMICGMMPPTAGLLSVLGYDTQRDARLMKANIGVVPDEYNLDVDLTVMENLEVYANFFNLPKDAARDKAVELLSFMEIVDKSRDTIDELSNGMKRRLLIARALINSPSLLILDEPTAGLDPKMRHHIWTKLGDLKRQGMTQILTTHYMDEAARLCDRLAIMDHGRIIERGEPAALVAKHGQPDLEAVFLKLTGRRLVNADA